MTCINRFSGFFKWMITEGTDKLYLSVPVLFFVFLRLKDAVSNDKLFETFTKHKNTG